MGVALVFVIKSITFRKIHGVHGVHGVNASSSSSAYDFVHAVAIRIHNGSQREAISSGIAEVCSGQEIPIQRNDRSVGADVANQDQRSVSVFLMRPARNPVDDF